MILNRDALLDIEPIENMSRTKNVYKGLSWGLTECGYDIRINQDITMFLGRRFKLASSIERFNLPKHVMGRVLNKSTWARLGVDASMTTNIEPGWKGYLTIELRYSKILPIKIPKGTGIAQIIFEEIACPVAYQGKYQNQANSPVSAIMKK